MNETLTVLAIVLMVAAIVGGGLSVLGHQLPVIASKGRQIVLFAFGVSILIAVHFPDRFRPKPLPPPLPAPVEPVTIAKPTPPPTVENKTDPPPALSLSSFLCGVNTYGSGVAASTRTQIQNKLVALGCNVDSSLYLYPAECREPAHTPASPNGDWKGFAARNSVIYYDDDNRPLALSLAAALKMLTGFTFSANKGGGQCINPTVFPRIIMIHFRDDVPK
ncbi:hypothetical protein [Ancylobacter defluvii]|nr:hypothetical protein [Ancylobacter defluvii]MBS7588431.1 hypothetical protein [Ancylobacter defluvii]